MLICFHGTTKENADKIMVEGFNVGTWFAAHLELALKFGGDYIFFVSFDERRFNNPSGELLGWQFHVRERIPPSQIWKLINYNPQKLFEDAAVVAVSN